MQQTATPGSFDTSTNACGTRRRRVVRNLVGAGLIGVALSWFVVTDITPVTGPYYGVFVSTRGSMLFICVIRTDSMSVEWSVWKDDDRPSGYEPKDDGAEPFRRLMYVSVGRRTEASFGE